MSTLPKPYYQDAVATLYLGDCREIVPLLGRFDLLLTDPPYGTGEITGGYGRAQNYGGQGRKILGDEDLSVCEEVLGLCKSKIEWIYCGILRGAQNATSNTIS